MHSLVQEGGPDGGFELLILGSGVPPHGGAWLDVVVRPSSHCCGNARRRLGGLDRSALLLRLRAGAGADRCRRFPARGRHTRRTRAPTQQQRLEPLLLRRRVLLLLPTLGGRRGGGRADRLKAHGRLGLACYASTRIIQRGFSSPPTHVRQQQRRHKGRENAGSARHFQRVVAGQGERQWHRRHLHPRRLGAEGRAGQALRPCHG